MGGVAGGSHWKALRHCRGCGAVVFVLLFVQPRLFLGAGRGKVVLISPLILCPALFSPAACKESKQPLEVSQRSEEMGLILGICAGGLAVLILLLGAIIIITRKG